MKLTEYVRRMHQLDRELENYQLFNGIAKELLRENAESRGRKYPTLDSLWKEAHRRALEHEMRTAMVEK